MNTSPHLNNPFQLRFKPLSITGRALVFACDASGHVDLDSLDRKERLNYLFARTLVGRDFHLPDVGQAMQPEDIGNVRVRDKR